MKKCLPYIVIVFLMICLILVWVHPKEVILEKHITDTITIVRIDTIIDTLPKFVYEKVLDTILIEKTSGNGLKLPITQRFYSTDSYQAWISGYKPNLDSINVFNKVVTENVTTSITKEIYPKTVDWYLNVGSMFIDNKAAPYIGFNIKLKSDLTIGANVGYFDKKAIYGINVGLKLNK